MEDERGNRPREFEPFFYVVVIDITILSFITDDITKLDYFCSKKCTLENVVRVFIALPLIVCDL